jgi:LacI family transcriptional regulator
MASLKQIARKAGVSIRTASRALRGSGYVGAGTREKVLGAAKELGYRPNRAARSLRTRRSYEVAVVAWSMDELHMAKVAGFERTLRDADYAVTVLFGREPPGQDAPHELIGELIARRPAAAAAFPSGDAPIGDWVAALADAAIPYVVFDTTAEADTIRIDRQQGVYEAVLYLAAKGRKRIAYLGTRADATRLVGYHRALEQLGREPIYIDLGSGSRRDAARDAARAFAELTPRPDAVQAFSDEVAMAFLAGLHDRGVAVPDDVALVGFDDRWAARLCWPPLTTVAQPNWDVGVAAAEMVLRKIAGEAPPPGGWSRSLPTRLVVRESA